MYALVSDIRYACRTLLKARGYTVTVLLSLALGIGTATLVCSIVDAAALRPPPFTRPQELVTLMALESERCPACIDVFVGDEFHEIAEQARSFASIAAYTDHEGLLTGASSAVRVSGARVTGRFFSVLGVHALRGRVLGEDDARAGAPPAVVLSHALWRQRFGSEDNIIGHTIQLDGTAFTVVGVMSPEFTFPAGARFWTSLVPAASGPDAPRTTLQGVARLRPGVTLEQARAELRVLARQRQLHETKADDKRGATAFALSERTRTMSSSTLLLLAGATGAMLLIVLANLQTLAVVRALGRGQELAVRTALGASRWQVARQLLVESLLLSSLGGALGVLLPLWGTNAASALMDHWFHHALMLHLDTRVLGAACVLSVCAGLAIGLAPVVQVIGVELGRALRDGGISATGSRRQRRLREIAVGVQLATTLTLLGAAGTLAKSVLYLQQVDMGYDANHLLVATLDFSGTRYADPAQARVLSQRLLDRFTELAGSANVAVWRTLSPSMMVPPGEDWVTIEGKPEGYAHFCHGVASCRRPTSTQDVSAGFFSTAAIAIRRGRAFTPEDGPGTPPVAIITESTARRWWPGEDPIGKRFKIGGATSAHPWMTVVGVTADAREVNGWALGGYEALHPDVYLARFFRPLAQTNMSSPGRPVGTASLLLGIHTPSDPQAFVATVRRELRSLAPDLPVSTVTSLRQVMLDGGTNALLQLNARIMIGLSLTALVLAILGLYGVVADTVHRRTRELAIRMALGARAGHVLTMVTRRGIVTGAAGILVGCILSRLFRDAIARAFFGATARYKQGYLVGAAPGDPLVIAAVGLLLLLVVALASYLTAHRATRVDPAEVLRAE
jgi:predicted permease